MISSLQSMTLVITVLMTRRTMLSCSRVLSGQRLRPLLRATRIQIFLPLLCRVRSLWDCSSLVEQKMISSSSTFTLFTRCDRMAKRFTVKERASYRAGFKAGMEYAKRLQNVRGGWRENRG